MCSSKTKNWFQIQPRLGRWCESFSPSGSLVWLWVNVGLGGEGVPLLLWSTHRHSSRGDRQAGLLAALMLKSHNFWTPTLAHPEVSLLRWAALDANRTSSQGLADGHGLKSCCCWDPSGSTHIVGRERDVLIRWGAAVHWRLTGGNGRYPWNICVKERGQSVLSWGEIKLSQQLHFNSTEKLGLSVAREDLRYETWPKSPLRSCCLPFGETSNTFLMEQLF